MESSEFITKIIELGVSYYRWKESENRWSSKILVHQPPKKDKKTGEVKNPPTMDDYLYHEWRSGGRSGGSCWDTGEPNYHGIDGDPEPDFKDLDTVLEAVCPNLTFLQYKRLMAAIIKTGERTENEYYGNYTNYASKSVRLGDLYDKLKEMKLA